MVDRYVLAWPEQTYHEFSNKELGAFWKENYNIRPGMSVPVVAANDSTKLQSFVFGIADKKITVLACDSYINSSSKLLGEERDLSELIKTNRCIVPALGFYVVPQLKKKVTHYCFTHFGVFSFAGIWLKNPKAKDKYSCCILSVKGQSILSKLGHSSSPVILRSEDEKTWLDNTTSEQDLVNLLKPFPSIEMNAWPVDNEVQNSTKNLRSFVLPRGGYIQTRGWTPEPFLGTKRFLCAQCCLHKDLKRFVAKRARMKARCNACFQHTMCIPVDENVQLIKLFRAIHRLTFQDVNNGMAYFRTSEEHYQMSRGVYESENGVLKNTAFSNFHKRSERSWYKSNNRVESMVYLLEYLLGRYSTDKELTIKYHQEKNYFESPLDLHPINFIKETDELVSDNRIQFSFSSINRVRSIIQNVVSKKILTKKINFRQTHFYRARMGYSKGGRGVYIDGNYFEGKPFSGPAIGTPPPELTTQGRLNVEGIPILYLASDVDTAICEIRPETGAYVSVGVFKSRTPDLKVIDLREIDILNFFETEEDLVSYYFLRYISKKLSSPVLSNTINRYKLTQIVSQCIAEANYDGILYNSAITFGYNLAVFDSSKFEDIKEGACIHFVSKVQYQHSVFGVLESHGTNV